MSAVKICPQCGQEFSGDLLFCPRDGMALRVPGDAGTDLVGRVVAERFHVLRALGHGGMGQVYLAEQVKIGRMCALKVIKPALVSSADAVLRFNREAANASRISHPNVIQVYDFGESADGLIFCAMEFVEGVSLATLLQEEGALPPRRAAAIALQIADALGAAHDLRIVHRDLKPENVMLARSRDGADVVKVVDFGVSRIMGDATQKVTSTGLVIGTLDYMSPEQFTGEPVDGRSDLYSLGIVVFRMLTGQLPFQARSALEGMEARVLKGAPTLAAARPDVAWPGGLQAVLDTVFATAPADRHETAADFAADLEAAVRDWVPDVPGAAVAWEARLRGSGAGGGATPSAGAGPRRTQGATAPREAAPPPPPPPAVSPAGVPPRSPGAAPVHSAPGRDQWTPDRRRRLVLAGGIGAVAVAAIIVAIAWPDGGDATIGARGGDSGSVAARNDSLERVRLAQKSESSSAGPEQGRGSGREGQRGDRGSGRDGGAGTGDSGGGDGRPAIESPELLRELAAIEVLTGKGSTDQQNEDALERLRRIAPRTREGRAEAAFREIEANTNLNRTEEVCRLIRELRGVGRGTRFEASLAVYAAEAAQACRDSGS
jgi:serine/threonine-protein kinase